MMPSEKKQEIHPVRNFAIKDGSNLPDSEGSIPSQNISNEVKISFFVPCYNEEKNVGTALEIIRTSATAHHLSYEIIAVDDASTDKTSEVIKKYAQEHPEVSIHLIRNEVNLGLGYNYIHTAQVAKGEYYMVVFGDHCVPIDALLEKVGQADIVVAYLENSAVRHWSRRVISWCFRTLINCISGNRLRHYTGTNIHRRENILRCEKVGHGFGYNAEILCKLIAEGKSYVEAPYRAEQQKKKTAAFRISNFLSVAGSIWRIFKMRFS